MKRRFGTLLVLGLLVAAAACHRKPKVPVPPPPPPRILLRVEAPLRDTADVAAPVTATLAKGTVVAVEKVTDKWGLVTTDDGKHGFVPRPSFARRAVVIGTDRFPYTYVVGDRLRKVPGLDVVRVEVVSRIMPASPAGGVDGAEQLDAGTRSALVIGVTGNGRQFLYEVVDREAHTVLLNTMTRDTIYMRKAVDELTDTITHVLEVPLPGATPIPGSMPSPTPTPHPESPHPNAPLPVATPAASPSATPTP